MGLAEDLAFMAQPGTVADWRGVVLVDAAAATGVLAALPGTADKVAAEAGTDPASTRTLLDGLAVFDVVTRDADGTYSAGPNAPDDDQTAVLRQHAGVIARWSTSLADRLTGTTTEADESGRPIAGTGRWLDSLAVGARRRAPMLVDACLAAVPDPVRVLDLAGGHGEYGLEFARRGFDVTMQDLPHVIDLAREGGRLEPAGVTLFPGDFFEALPEEPFDLVLLAGVAHTFPRPRLEALYRHILTVTRRGLVVSASIRDGSWRSTLFAVQMLAGRNGAHTHTEDVHRDSLRAAGFSRVETHPMPSGERDLLVGRV